MVTDNKSPAVDAVTGLAQSDLIGSFETLVDKMGILKIGDEISKLWAHALGILLI